MSLQIRHIPHIIILHFVVDNHRSGYLEMARWFNGSHGFSSDLCMRNFVHGGLFHYFLMI